VDDDGDWRALLEDTLTDEGFEVVTAADGRAACDCFRRVKPSVVVTDVEMPCMDGSELLARLSHLDRAIPVIVITAEDVQDTRPFAGAFGFVRKPATTDAVTTAVKEALRRGQGSRLRKLWISARAAADAARVRGYAVASGPGRVAVIAGVGVAAVAAILIAAMRTPAA